MLSARSSTDSANRSVCNKAGLRYPRYAPEVPKEEAAQWRRQGRWIGCMASFLLAMEVLLFLVIASLAWLPLLFNYAAYAITSNSMEPTMGQGDLIYVNANVSANDMCIGDIVAFRQRDGGVSFRRVVGVDQGACAIYTKGDSLEIADAEPVNFDFVLGKVESSIGALGIPVLYYQKHKVLCVAVTVGVACILWALTLVFPGSGGMRGCKDSDR